MSFKIEIEDKIKVYNDEIRLMADIYFKKNETTICLYFSAVMDGIDENVINRTVNFLNNVINVKRHIESNQIFQSI